jgi:hypothetical protein
MNRRTFLRRSGMGLGTIAVIGSGGLAYRAYDQGVLATGEGPAFDAWENWQHATGVRALVGAAILAPSPHNAQAWLFDVGQRHIDVHADPARSTGALDPFRREMHIGLGAALENIVLAARATGLTPTVELMPTGGSSNHVAHIALEDAPARPSELARQIPLRHTNRYPYDTTREVPGAALAAMSGLADPAFAEATVVWVTDARERGDLGELLVDATRAIITDEEQSADDFEWYRQSWDDIQRRRDGITIDTAGLSDVATTLAKLLPAQSKETTGEYWLDATRNRHTKTAAAYGIVAVRDVHDAVQQLNGGRLLERIHLWATANGVAVHHMNQATERVDREAQLGLAPRFGTALDGLMPSGWHALSTFRIGFPTRQPRRSPRRPVTAVIVP